MFVDCLLLAAVAVAEAEAEAAVTATVMVSFVTFANKVVAHKIWM